MTHLQGTGISMGFRLAHRPKTACDEPSQYGDHFQRELSLIVARSPHLVKRLTLVWSFGNLSDTWAPFDGRQSRLWES